MYVFRGSYAKKSLRLRGWLKYFVRFSEVENALVDNETLFRANLSLVYKTACPMKTTKDLNYSMATGAKTTTKNALLSETSLGFEKRHMTLHR